MPTAASAVLALIAVFSAVAMVVAVSAAPSVWLIVIGNVETLAFVKVNETASPAVKVVPLIAAIEVAVKDPPDDASTPPVGVNATVSFPAPVTLADIVVGAAALPIGVIAARIDVWFPTAP